MTQASKTAETDILRLVAEGIRTLRKPDSITVSLCADLADPRVCADREGIGKMLADLLTNGIEAMPAGGVLTVQVGGDREQVRISIEDTGVGIPPENMDQLFIPFFTTKPVGEGTGLGLPFAYGMVKAHSGRITVESNSDPRSGPTGTRVRILLPRGAPQPAPAMRVILHEG